MSHQPISKESRTQKGTSGFTIIEVLIVLAIAGLILLIVFLAVPALQRNSRNTAIKTDVQNVLGGVAEYAGANNGTLPTNVLAVSGKVNYTGLAGTGTNPTSINIQGSTVVGSTLVAPLAATPALGTIAVSLGYRCDTTKSPRAISAVYAIESSGPPIRLCQDS